MILEKVSHFRFFVDLLDGKREVMIVDEMDREIVSLLFKRNEEALKLLSSKYGKLCTYIANNIVFSAEDCEECVNDVLLDVWNTIPPQNPSSLSAFVSELARRRALDRIKYDLRQKRNIGEREQFDYELEELILDYFNVEDELRKEELRRTLNQFLVELDKISRIIFIRRYYMDESIIKISKDLHISEIMVKAKLKRSKRYLKSI